VVAKEFGAYRLFRRTKEFKFEIPRTSRDWTFRVVMLPTCEFMYGIVKVSKKKVVLSTLEVMAPVTLRVPDAVTLVVVTELAT
jgi:hypothetical protein